MGMFSWQHWLIVLVIVLVLFGKGKVSDFMGDVAKGIKAFKKGMADDSAEDTKTAQPSETNEEPKRIEHQPATLIKESNKASSSDEKTS